MQKVFDYAGNEIKEGQEIVLIRILKRTPRFGYVIPATKEEFWSEKVPDEECFETSEPIKLDRNLGYWIEGETHKTYNTVSVLKAVFLSDTEIIAIKGISDTKEYYDTWKAAQKILT